MSESSIQSENQQEREQMGLIDRFWTIGLFQLLLLLAVLFFSEIASVQADGLFDFQMKLAQKGNAEAQFKVGEMYETGFGTKKSMKDAEIWTNKAAAQGHETAGFKLLYWDMQKNGMKGANKAKFDDLMKKAEAGNGQAMFYVGKMHAHGVGMSKNYDVALDWLNKATFIGIVEAEREAVAVRDEKQRLQVQQHREEQQRRAEDQAKKDEEKRKQEDAKRKEQERKRLDAQKAEQQRQSAAESKREAEMAQQKQAEARAAAEAEAAEKEKRRQALLKKREEEEAARKAKFEADPCSGKSARFLSTCK